MLNDNDCTLSDDYNEIDDLIFSDEARELVISGRLTSIGLKGEFVCIYNKFGVNSRHFTYIFNVFVVM